MSASQHQFKMRMAILLPIVALTSASFSHGQEVRARIDLPSPTLIGDVSVEEALQKRRSLREYAAGALTLEEVSQLLWAAQGINRPPGYRTAPSAGALYPLEVYLVAGTVEGLEDGVYLYIPRHHAVEKHQKGDLRADLAAAALSQDWIRDAPAVLVFAGVVKRTAVKYGARAERYVHIEVGHAAQNVYLQAVALDLGTVMVGAFRDARVQEALGLPGEHAPFALMPVGRPRPE